MDERLIELERRVERLEERLQDYHGALQDDPEMVQQTVLILRLIRECPGGSQRGICQAAKVQFGISRGRALEILRRETEVLWRTGDGAFNSKLYYECERNTGGTPQHSKSAVGRK